MITLSLVLVCAAVLASCGGSSSSGTTVPEPVVSGETTSMTTDDASARFEQDTELTSAVQGLTVEKIYLVDGNDQKISASEVALNSKFSIVYEGVKNFALKDGKAFPNLSIQVMDNDQQTVLNETDLLASYTEGLSVEDASVLRATITVGDPIKVGKYMCSVQVVDKNNTNSAILSNWEFDVK